MNWLDRLPWTGLLIAAFAIGLAPFLPEPHLVEKLRLLAHGQLQTPLDVFDLVFHAALPLLVLVKLIRSIRRSPPHSSHNQ